MNRPVWQFHNKRVAALLNNPPLIAGARSRLRWVGNPDIHYRPRLHLLHGRFRCPLIGNLLLYLHLLRTESRVWWAGVCGWSLCARDLIPCRTQIRLDLRFTCLDPVYLLDQVPQYRVTLALAVLPRGADDLRVTARQLGLTRKSQRLLVVVLRVIPAHP